MENNQRPTMKTNIFHSSESHIAVVFIDDNYAPDQDAQIHVSINGNSFSIIL